MLHEIPIFLPHTRGTFGGRLSPTHFGGPRDDYDSSFCRPAPGIRSSTDAGGWGGLLGPRPQNRANLCSAAGDSKTIEAAEAKKNSGLGSLRLTSLELYPR